MKKAIKIIGIVFLVPIFLFLLLVILLYLPPFQNWAVKQVASIASEKTGMEISVEHVNLAFPLDLAVDGVKVIKPNDSLPQVKDTIADIQHTVVDVQLLPLFKAQVEVDALDIQTVKFNTVDLVAAARVRGKADKLQVKSHGIDLDKETVMLNAVLLDGADIDVQLNDSVPEDTTTSENNWKIDIGKLTVNNSSLSLHMPGDTLAVRTAISKVEVRNGHFDLKESLYEVAKADASLSHLAYDNNFEPFVKGLDYNHIRLSDFHIGLDSIRFKAPDLRVKLRTLKVKEQSGIAVSHANGAVEMDSLRLRVPSLFVSTPHSDLRLLAEMDMNAFDEVNPGNFSVEANGKLGKSDLMLFMDGMPAAFRNAWPHYPLSFDCGVHGNLRYLDIDKFTAELPTAFKAEAKGYVTNVMDTDNLLANVNLDVTTQGLGFATRSFLDPSLRQMIRVPSGISLKGNVGAKGALYKADLKAMYGGGWVALKGMCNVRSMTYDAKLQAHALPLQKFLPGMSLSPFSGKVSIVGVGTDVFSPKMRLEADAEIERFTCSDFDLTGTTAHADIHDGRIVADLSCINKVLHGDISVDALMDMKNVRATVACSLDKVDFQGMKLIDVPLSTSLCAHVDVASDLEDYYKVEGFVSDVVIQDSANIYRPGDMDMNIVTRTDSTWAKVQSGDFSLDLEAGGGYKALMQVTDLLTHELTRQIERKYISQDSLKQVLPVGRLRIHTGKDNLFTRYAERMDYSVREVNVDIATSPVTGLNGYAQIDSLCVPGMQLDKIRFDLVTDEAGFRYKAQVKNEKNNPQYCFNALLDGSLFETGSDINVRLYDDRNDLALRMGLRAMLEEKGIRIRLDDTGAILGYRKFTANKDNYLFVADDNRVSANMKLKAADGTGFQIYSDDDDLDALQNITLSIHKLDLASVLSVLPYMPRIEGVLNGDYHVIQTDKELSLSTSMSVNRLYYEGCRMGDIATEFVYMPLEDGSHYVDGMMMHDGKDVGTIKGTYHPTDSVDILDADVNLARLPLYLVNGFVPDQIIGLRGYGDGRLSIHGPMSKLDVEGEVELDSAYLVSVPYGVELSLDERPVKIKDSKLLLKEFNMCSHNRQPLVLDGNINFSNLEKMTIDMRMKARNFLLIDAKENRRSEAFGRAFVNFDALISGPLASMNVRGKLDVLGTSDITYIMRDTPLSTDNRLAELVKFTDFNSQKEETIERPTLEGLYVDMAINIDQGVRCFCALNAVKSNYVDLVGGGSLRFTMRGDDMRMTGRYTISNGEMKYSLPVIPLQTFNIESGSYVEFAGDVMNPKLNITALETIKSNVNENGSNRMVQFETGVVITQTLNDMGLEFVVDAPEDMTVHGNLQTMSKEERGKIAVSMLTTGMYLSGGNTAGMSMNSAFNSFLQSEINSITGNALRTLDLSIGLNNSTDATGQLHTDYSFKFAKRFWNNRVRLVVGGKVSSGTSQTQSLFDNLSLEYRLDQSANTNLKVFYERQVYDYLEGYLGQYGVGLVWKQKLQRITDIFKVFNKQKPIQNPAATDTVNTDTTSLKKRTER